MPTLGWNIVTAPWAVDPRLFWWRRLRAPAWGASGSRFFWRDSSSWRSRTEPAGAVEETTAITINMQNTEDPTSIREQLSEITLSKDSPLSHRPKTFCLSAVALFWGGNYTHDHIRQTRTRQVEHAAWFEAFLFAHLCKVHVCYIITNNLVAWNINQTDQKYPCKPFQSNKYTEYFTDAHQFSESIFDVIIWALHSTNSLKLIQLSLGNFEIRLQCN